MLKMERGGRDTTPAATLRARKLTTPLLRRSRPALEQNCVVSARATTLPFIMQEQADRVVKTMQTDCQDC